MLIRCLQAVEVLKGFYGEFIQIKAKQNPAPTAPGYERYKAEGAGSPFVFFYPNQRNNTSM